MRRPDPEYAVDIRRYTLHAVSKASLNGFAKVRGSCIVGPLVRAGPVPASLGGNYKASRVRKQRFGNQFLAYI